MIMLNTPADPADIYPATLTTSSSHSPEPKVSPGQPRAAFSPGSIHSGRSGARAPYRMIGADGTLTAPGPDARPLAAGANYAAVKAAEEAWARAMAQGFAKAADAGASAAALRAASVIFRVRSLAGLEDDLAAAFVGLWDAEASAVNDQVIALGA